MSCPSGSPGSGHTATRTNWYYKWYLNRPSTQRLRREGLGVKGYQELYSIADSRPACLYQETLSGENWLD